MATQNNSGAKQSTFEKLCEPINPGLEQHQQDHPAHHRETLHFPNFVRILIYYFSKYSASRRQLVTDLETAPVYELGRAIRRHSFFEPAGTNADFVQILDSHHVALRTYERGVEDETLACGTGAVASAILTAYKGLTKSPVHVQTRGGEILTAYFELKGEEVREVFLEGEAILVYSACLDGDV